MLKMLSKMLRDERGFIATTTALATAAIVGVAAAGTAGIVAAAKSGGSNKGAPGAAPEAPQVGSGSQDISRDEMRKRGRAALIATSSQGVLDNAPTGRSQLLGN